MDIQRPAIKMSTEEIYNILKQEILSLKILPGELISENDISKRFNISRTPVRSAFSKLSTDKLIEIRPQKGTYVSLLDFELIKQLIYMRTVLEINVVSLAMEYINQEVINEFENNLARQKMFLNNQTKSEDFFLIDSQLHEICFKITDKERLWDIIQDFQVHYTRFRILDIVVTKKFEKLYEEHCMFVDIIRNKQIDEVKPFFERHLKGGVERLGNKLRIEFKDYFID